MIKKAGQEGVPAAATKRPDEMSGGVPAAAATAVASAVASAAASAPAHGGSRGEERVDGVEGVQQDAASGEETGEQEEEEEERHQRRSQRQSEKDSPPRQQHKHPRRQHQRRQQKQQRQQQEQQQEEEELEGKRRWRSASPLSRRSMSPSAGDSASGARARCLPGGADVHLDMPPPNSAASELGSKTAQRGSVQRLLEEEGHDARNVVSWLVPNLSNGGGGRGVGSGGVIVDARAEAVRGGGVPAGRSWRAQDQQQQQARGWRGERPSRDGSRERDHARRKSPMSSPFKGSNESQTSSKATPGRGSSDSMTQGFNQRLWGYLFRNVNRAVDELYYLCEAEGSATHCMEAAELLEGCGRDFSKLIERIADQKRFEEEQRAARAAERLSPETPQDGGYASATEPGSRTPKGLVWEVRKTTSASTASAMVLNAIERMESHASGKEQVCSTSRRGTDTTWSRGLRVDGGGGDSCTAPSACMATNTAISTAAGEAAMAATPPSRVPCPSMLFSDPRGGDGTELLGDQALAGKSHGREAKANGRGSPCPGPTEGSTAAAGEHSAARAAGPSSVAGTSSIIDRRVSGRGPTEENGSCSGRSASFDDAEAAAAAAAPVISFGSLGDDDVMDGGGCDRAAIGKVQVDRGVPSTALASSEAAEVGPRSVAIDEPAPAAKDLPAGEPSAAAAVACGGGGIHEEKEGHAHEEGRLRMEMEVVRDEAERGGIAIAGGREECEGLQDKARGDVKDLASGGRPAVGIDGPQAAGRQDEKTFAVAGPAAAAAAVATTDATTAADAAAGAATICAAASSAAAEITASRDQEEDTCRQADTVDEPSSGTAAGIANGSAASLGSKRTHPVPRKTSSRLNPRAAPFRFDSAAPCSASAAELDHGGGRSATPKASAPASAQAPSASASTPTAARALTPATMASASAATAATPGERNRSLGPAGRSRLAEAKGEAAAMAAPAGSAASSSLPATPLAEESLPSTGAPARAARRAPVTEESTAGASPYSVKSGLGGDGNEDRSNAPSGKTQKQRQRHRQRQKKKKRKAASQKLAGQDGDSPSGNADSKDDARAVACIVPASARATAVDVLRNGGCSGGASGTTERSGAQPAPSSLTLPPGTAIAVAAAAVPGRPPFAKVESRGQGHFAEGRRNGVESASGQAGKGGGDEGGDVVGHGGGLDSAQGTGHDVSKGPTDEAAADAAPVLSPPPPPSLPASGKSNTVIQNAVNQEKAVAGEAGLKEQQEAEPERLVRQGCGVDTDEVEGGGGEGAAREDNQQEEEDEEEEEDPDSAYVNAMEEIWAEAEAWVDAEAQAEEEAWARLPEDVPCCGPSESDGGGPFSDVEESPVATTTPTATGTAATATVGAAVGQGQRCSSSGRSSTTCGPGDKADDDDGVANGSIRSTSAEAEAASGGSSRATLNAERGPNGQQTRASRRTRSSSGGGPRADAPLSGGEGGQESDGRDIGNVGDGGDDKSTLLELEIEIPAAGEDDADGDGALQESWDRSGERLDMEVDRLSEDVDGKDARVKSKLGKAKSSGLLGNDVGASGGGIGGGSSGTGRRKTDDRQVQDGQRLLPSSACALSSGFQAAAVSKAGDGGGNGGRLLFRPDTQHSPHQRVDSGGGSVGQEGYPAITRTPSGSGASCFGVERGSSCDVPEGWGPFPHRELQKKLSSPQRKPQRKILSAAEAKLRQERRQMMAELNRAMRANGITEKLKQHEERARGVRFRKEVQLLKAEEEAKRKMEGADARRKEHRRGIVRKANDANSKVEEVLFMNKLTVEDLKITLQMKLAEVDRRIQGGRARRQQLLAGISDRQRKRTRDKAAQMSEKRVEAEAATAMRWEALQERLEVVQQRRRDRARETSRRMQAANRHTQARERRKAMLHLPARGSVKAGEQGHGRAAVGLVDSRRKGTNTAAVAADKHVIVSKDRGNGGGDTDNNVIDNSRSKCTASNSSVAHTTRDRNADPDADKSAQLAGATFGKSTDRSSTRASSVAQQLAQVPSSSQEATSTAITGSLSEDPDGTPFAITATACHRRGRAQKKRARKIKDRTRQLCLDSCAAAPTAEAPTPWPRLDKAAKALAELARAKAQLADSKAVAQVAQAPADAAAIRNPAEGLAAASTSAAGDDDCDSPVLETTTAASDTILAHEGYQNAEYQQAIGNSRADGAETAEKEEQATAGIGAVVGAARTAGKGRAAVLLAEAGAEELRKTSGSEGEASGYGSSGVDHSASEPFPTHRKTRRGKRAGGAVNRRRGAKAKAAAGLLAATASAGPLISSPYAVPVADVEEYAGGGRFEQPGEVTWEGGPARNGGDAECLDSSESGGGLARRQHQERGVTLAADEGRSAAVGRSGRKKEGVASGTETADGCTAAVSLDSESGRASGSNERRKNRSLLSASSAAVDVYGGPPLEDCSPSLPQPPGSTRRRSALESAAWGSLRELRGMCPPPFFAASCPWSPAVSLAEESPARAAPPDPHTDAAVSDPPTAATAATADVRSGVNHGLLSQMRARGVLDSLVAVCAPFPWTPVSPPVDLGGIGGAGKQRTRRDSASTAVAAAHAGEVKHVRARSPSSSFAPSTSEPRTLSACLDHSSRVETISGSGIGDAGIGGGREAMTEMALDVLFGALVDDTSNRDHVLRIDGGAALVDCLSRLLERATRHGDTTKRPLPRPRPPVLSRGAVAYASTEVEDDWNNMSGLSSKRVTEQGKRQEEAATTMAKAEACRKGGNNLSRRVVNHGPGVELPATSKALCERDVGAEVGVEAALPTALAVVSLLVRHKALDKSVTRIQEGLVRYLVAKRLLHDLAVLACQLHPFCTAAAAAAAAAAATASSIKTAMPRGTEENDAKQKPDTLGSEQQGRSPPPVPPLHSPSSSKVTATGPVPMVMSAGTGMVTAKRRHSLKSRPPGSPLSVPAPPRLVLCRKSTSVGSNLSSSRPPSPSRLSSAQPSSPPPLPPPLVQVAGRIAELVDAVTAHPLLGARERNSTTPPPPAVVATTAAGSLTPAAAAATVEDSASPLPLSSPCTREPAGADRAWPLSSGMPGVLGSLVSLLAAMVGAEIHQEWQQQQQEQRHRQQVEELPLSHLGVQGVLNLPEEQRCNTSPAAGAAPSATGARSSRIAPPPALTDSREATAGAKAVSAAMAATGTATTTVTASPATASFGVSDGLLRLASVVVRAANRACLHDLIAVQDALSSQGVQPEFAFLCDHLLAALVERVNAQEATNPDSKPTELEEWMEGLVTLVGYFCLENPIHQESLHQGPSPTVLQRLCNLPFRYFSEPRHRSVLLPALVSICYDNVGNRLAAENYLHADFLASFLEDNLQEYCASDLPAGVGAGAGLAAATEAAARAVGKPIGVDSVINSVTTSNGHSKDATAAATAANPIASLPEQIQSSAGRSALSTRFPRKLWENAILFFRLSPRSKGAQ